MHVIVIAASSLFFLGLAYVSWQIWKVFEDLFRIYEHGYRARLKKAHELAARKPVNIDEVKKLIAHDRSNFAYQAVIRSIVGERAYRAAKRRLDGY